MSLHLNYPKNIKKKTQKSIDLYWLIQFMSTQEKIKTIAL